MSSLRIFAATALADVPTDCRRYVSVDGTVPGALESWDHHVTGEAINLDAMPDRIDTGRFDSVCTTRPDTDALASVVAVLAGGASALDPTVLAVLRAASHRCDHLVAAPGVSAQADAAGLGLHRWVVAGLAQASTPPMAAEVFARQCAEVWARIQSGLPMPFAEQAEALDALGAALVAAGRLVAQGPVGLADQRGADLVEPDVLYRTLGTALGVFVADHPSGGLRYTIGRNPFRTDAPDDLGQLLAELARLEHGHGPPCLAVEPVPGAENWGGRAPVFGSPWNYGSRLEVHEVVGVAAAFLQGT